MLNDGNGRMFWPGEPWRKERKRKTHNLNIDYNRTYEDETEKRREILTQIFGAPPAEGVFLQGPIAIHYGVHTRIGKNTFINFNFTCQDDAEVTVGENCDFGPNVTIVTPIHPLVASERKLMACPDGAARRLCYAKPVRIGDRCWLGANVVVLPGVEIGENCVIGAGSVVTRSIPANSFAAGNPCRVIREITENDSLTLRPEILGDCRPIE